MLINILLLCYAHATAFDINNGGHWFVNCYFMNETTLQLVNSRSEIWDVLNATSSTDPKILTQVVVNSTDYVTWEPQKKYLGRYEIMSFNSSISSGRPDLEAFGASVGVMKVSGEGYVEYPLRSMNYTINVISNGYTCYPIYYIIWGQGKLVV